MRPPTEDELRFVTRIQQAWIARRQPMLPAVPDALRVDLDDPDEWQPWRAIPSTLTNDALCHFEQSSLDASLPALYRAFLLSLCALDVEAASCSLWERLPEDPLAKLRFYVRANAREVAAGYVPIGWERNDAGCAFLDLRRPDADGDCPVVCLDHDRVGDASRAHLESIARPIAPSFRALLEELASE